MATQRVLVGQKAENIAAASLVKRGYTILDNNYRKPWGELDLVASKNGVVIFVEVKSNSVGFRGFEPELRANAGKRLKIIRTARTYLIERNLTDQPWQIDIISVTFHAEKGIARITHFKNIEI